MLWKEVAGPNAAPATATGGAGQSAEDYLALRVRIHQRLLELLNLSLLEKTPRAQLRLEIRNAVGPLLNEDKKFLTAAQTEQLIDDVLDELLGLGPLEPLLKDDSISDILINTHTSVGGAGLDHLGNGLGAEGHRDRAAQRADLGRHRLG
jgi:pilus assembly protein CpaF